MMFIFSMPCPQNLESRMFRKEGQQEKKKKN